ncbi:MAG: hypothetical protein NC918_02610 [Candidatus Omnitrophica bacterium]|nr:hypothetical protein [Candidatus Omnitrophota bacterium]
MNKYKTGDIANELIVVNKTTIDRILSCGENQGELLALYMFYYYTAKWQKTNKIKCTLNYASKGLGWGVSKVKKYKKKLKELNLITNEKRVDENNRIAGHYVLVKYVLEIPEGEEPEDEKPSGPEDKKRPSGRKKSENKKTPYKSSEKSDSVEKTPEVVFPPAGKTTTNAYNNYINALDNYKNAYNNYNSYGQSKDCPLGNEKKFNAYLYFLTKYEQYYRQKYVSNNNGKEARLCKLLAEKLGEEKYRQAVDYFITQYRDDFCKKNGFNIVSFNTKINAILLQMQNGKVEKGGYGWD